MKRYLNIVYLSSWMFIVIALLVFSIARDGLVSLFGKKKSTRESKNQAHKKENKSAKYVITRRRELHT